MKSLLVFAILSTSAIPLLAAEPEHRTIDRNTLVARHNPHINEADPLAPFSLGNGRFAFTADVTGLQSFPSHYASGIPLATLSEWGWHSFPNTNGYKLQDTLVEFDTYGRPVPYPYDQHSESGQWLRGNPHRLGLGRIGFEFVKADGSLAQIEDVKKIDQTLDLWTGLLDSKFAIEGQTVHVQTVCHPHRDLVAVKVESPLIEQGRLRVVLKFGYGTSDWGLDPNDWEAAGKHQSEAERLENGVVRISRILDAERHSVELAHSPDAQLEKRQRHEFVILPDSRSNHVFSLSVSFSPNTPAQATLPSFNETVTRSRHTWNDFWQTGGAISFEGSSDPRASELERRIVLSQYLTAIQCRGKMPPQETGLTYNSWYGKPHLEMHWWHGSHFALWDRLPALEATLPWYRQILPVAQAIAEGQGYDGARWPKNVDPKGNQVPSTIAPLLIWQQPHPIYFAELCYRQRPGRETSEAYSQLVFETADFMASYPHFADEDKTYHLGPPLIPAQESYDPKTARDPPFELAYWRWGLETAQTWRERLGLPRNEKWDHVINNLAPYPLYQDRYATAEGVWNTIDHPSVLAAYGMLPGAGIDKERMRRTLNHVMETWPWEHTWGWDYPMIAMTAARLEEPHTAIDALMLDVPKNTYLKNGHNYQEAERLRLYLPGNGGLLAAVAMMAAGWDGAPDIPTPGFPQDGTWTVQWENLRPMP